MENKVCTQVGKWNIESRSGMHEDKHGEKSQQVIPSIQPLHTYVRTLIHVYVRTYVPIHIITITNAL